MLAVILLPLLIETWLFPAICVIAALRIIAALIGVVRFKELLLLHTYLNKAAGCAVFAFPLLYMALMDVWANLAAGAVCLICAAATLEEGILLCGDKPSPDCKGLWERKTPRKP